ncbi:helix-turn-helix transcriptional regulator [Chitinolyticbacter albus]|uniref:helix-turn-helix transcriptional regulator n=1 Tax=Chitinolyticbacter albus TaxID=2961951 RepID=UPI00210C9DA9|nr:AraC family transcriptional regulator [Chitinolyticbacter albus]
MIALRDGLTAHCSDTVHAHQGQQLLEPHLDLVLMLEGEADVHYGRQPFHFGMQRTRSGMRHEAVLLSVAEPDVFTRHAPAARPERKISIAIAPAWLDACGLDDQPAHRDILAFCGRHLAISRWQPSARQLALAEQLLQPDTLVPALARLQQESHAIELVSGALGQLAVPDTGLPRIASQRMQRLRQLLDSGHADEWSLPMLASEFGVAVNTLQQHFKQAFGCTVFDYQRRRRLQAARAELATGRVSVTEAALNAGYNSPANFATAFRRAFGISPRDCRG